MRTKTTYSRIGQWRSPHLVRGIIFAQRRQGHAGPCRGGLPKLGKGGGQFFVREHGGGQGEGEEKLKTNREKNAETHHGSIR
jgi:hypothetical protein